MLLVLVLVLEYWLKGKSSKELTVTRDGDPGGWPEFISIILLCSSPAICSMLLIATRNIHIRVCWSIPWETGHRKFSKQKSQNNFSDFILIRLGGHYNSVLISMLDKCPSVRINKNSDWLSCDRILLTIKGRFSCLG